MVDTLRIVLGAAAIACMLQSLDGTTIVPPTTLGDLDKYDIEVHLDDLIGTLQHRQERLIEDLESQLQWNYVTKISYNIKNVLDGVKAEQDTFNKNKTDLDPKYANCSAMQMNALQAALSNSEELLWRELIKVQSTATSFAVQQILSFYTSDISVMFDPCRRIPGSPPEEELRQCVDDIFAIASAKLVAYDDASEDKLQAAIAEGFGSAGLVFGACQEAVTAASEALNVDLSRCKDDVDRGSRGAGRWKNMMWNVGRWKCRFVNGVFRCDF